MNDKNKRINIQAELSEKDAQVERKEVKSFLERVKKHLQNQGLI